MINKIMSTLVSKKKIICLAVLIGIIITILPKEIISPILIICLGLLIGSAMASVCIGQKRERDFMLILFIAAFLLRSFISLIICAMNMFLKGAELIGDGWCYSENGYLVLLLWQRGVANITEIYKKIVVISASGTLSSYDFWNAIVYYFTGKSPLSMLFINCFAGSIIIFFVYYITKRLGTTKAAVCAAILTAFWPSLFLWSTQNLKDTICTFLMCMLVGLTVSLKYKFRILSLFLFIIASFLLFRLRSIFLLAFYACLLIFLTHSIILKKPKISLSFIIIIAFSILLLREITVTRGAMVSRLQEKLTSNLNFMFSMRTYRAYGTTAFLEWIDFRTFLGFIIFLPLTLAVSWLAPFPWQLENMLQAIVLPETVLYYVLLIAMLSGVKFSMKYKIREGGFLIVNIFINLIILAFFEGNIGTLFRHRSMILPSIFILGSIGFSQVKHSSGTIR